MVDEPVVHSHRILDRRHFYMPRADYRISLPEPTRATLPSAFAGSLHRSRCGSAHWRRCRAGALVLSLVDETLHRRKRAACSDREYLKVRRAIAAVEPQSTRRSLSAILDCIMAGSPPAHQILDTLADYAERLRRSGELAVAGKVYQFIIDAAVQARLLNRLPTLYRWMGFCLREAGETDEALRAYDKGMANAVALGDIREQLLIRIAQANLHRAKGYFDLACTMLDHVIQHARAHNLLEILARAAHDRGFATYELGTRTGRHDQLARALEDYTTAFHAYDDDNGRCRLLNDIGRLFFRLGHTAEARRAFTIAHEAGLDRIGRWAAAINLIMVAVTAEDHGTFDQYRALLEPAPLPARLRAEFLSEVAEGYAHFGLQEEASRAFARAERIRRRFRIPRPSDALNPREASRGAPESRSTRLPELEAPIMALSQALLAIQ